MKVKELIKHLSVFDLNMEVKVMVEYEETITDHKIGSVGVDNGYDDNEHVFLGIS